MIKFLTFFLLFSYSSYAQINLDTLRIKDSNIYQFVIEWSGVRYKFGGVDKNGIDCSGLTKKLYQNVFNISLPRKAIEQYKIVTSVSKDSLVSGDLVFFRGGRWHVGVYLIDGYFLHSENHKTGVRINKLSDYYYKKSYIGGGRVLN